MRTSRCVVDELEEVAVAGDDVDGHLGARREGADDVVGLVVVGAHHADAERGEHLEDDRDLRLERVGHHLDVGRVTLHDVLDAMGLVRRHQVDAPLRPPVVVPRADQVTGGVVADQPGDELQQAAHRVDVGAVGCLDLGHPEEGPEVHRRGVQDHQALAGGGAHPGILPSAGQPCDRLRHRRVIADAGPTGGLTVASSSSTAATTAATSARSRHREADRWPGSPDPSAVVGQLPGPDVVQAEALRRSAASASRWPRRTAHTSPACCEAARRRRSPRPGRSDGSPRSGRPRWT